LTSSAILAATSVSLATSRNTVPRWSAGSSQPGSSDRVTPTQVDTGANKGKPAGAVAPTVSATARDRIGPTKATASGSRAAATPAATGSPTPCATCAIAALARTVSTSAASLAGRAECTTTGAMLVSRHASGAARRLCRRERNGRHRQRLEAAGPRATRALRTTRATNASARRTAGHLPEIGSPSGTAQGTPGRRPVPPRSPTRAGRLLGTADG